MGDYIACEIDLVEDLFTEEELREIDQRLAKCESKLHELFEWQQIAAAPVLMANWTQQGWMPSPLVRGWWRFRLEADPI